MFNFLKKKKEQINPQSDADNVNVLSFASISIPLRIGRVVLVETALPTVLRALANVC